MTSESESEGTVVFLSLGPLALGEASCWVMRTLELLYGEAHVVRPPAKAT